MSAVGGGEVFPSDKGRLRLAAATFAILALELALIRWMGSQIRIFSYFANLVLLAAFLGMGLGIQLGRRRPNLVRWALPVLAVLSAVLAFAPELGLVHIRFPDPSIVLWGVEDYTTLVGFVRGAAIVLALFWAIVVVFLCMAAPVGWLFDRMQPLEAYSADLAGSLLGVIAMTAAAALGTSPPVWLAIVVLPLLWLAPGRLPLLSAAAVLVLAGLSIRGALFSPYNRLDVSVLATSKPVDRGQDWIIFQNRDYSQKIYDFSPGAADASESRRFHRAVYELPFLQSPPGGRALVVGAGTGNDVAAALRRGFREVVAVEIDPQVVAIGRRLHPERPYAAPQTRVVIDDARAYFEQHRDETFDAICYGLLDSHAVFSSMSSLRLENYVYTVEGLRAGWEHVREGGVLSVCFSVGTHPFVADRIFGALREATGRPAVVVAHGSDFGVTFLVRRGALPIQVPPEIHNTFTWSSPDTSVRIPEDDWPFLYLKPRSFPTVYLIVLALVVLTAWTAVRAAYGREALSAGRFDLTLFLMGAAFLLLETRMVTALSLLFGSTWVVNASVFAGVLLTVFVANRFVVRRTPRNPFVWYVPLCASLLATWVVTPGVLNRLGLLERGLLGGLIYAIPAAFAGVLFSTFLKRAKEPASALGSNLLGAVIGGVLEYSSMLIGLRSLTLVALVLYLGSYLVASKRREPATA